MAEKAKARCLAEPNSPKAADNAGQSHDVVLYLDRSASMQGFLDPEYPTRIKTDFRSVLDAVIAGLRPAQVHSYGSSVSRASASIGVLGNKAFYQDRDTRMEEVIDLVRKDSGESLSHLIIGDGRRGSPATADDQYVRLRDAAQKWVDAGGYFLVASSNAPFKTVESDPSGCRKSSAESGGQTCPIYLFAFIRSSDALRITSTVTDAFEHLFIWPALPVPPNQLLLRPLHPSGKLNVNGIWERSADGAPIVRTSARERTTKSDVFTVTMDTSTASNRAYQHLVQGEESHVMLSSRSLRGDPKQGWQQITTGIIRVVPTTPATVEITSLGGTEASSIVRMDVIPTGQPSWLSLVEATDAKDAVRTYGIGRLFEMFRQAAKQHVPSPIARLYFVSN